MFIYWLLAKFHSEDPSLLEYIPLFWVLGPYEGILRNNSKIADSDGYSCRYSVLLCYLV